MSLNGSKKTAIIIYGLAAPAAKPWGTTDGSFL